MTCTQAYIDRIERDTVESIKNIEVNTSTTGALYGVIVPKNGTFVMKHDNPQEVTPKKFNGLECANRSVIKDHIRNLVLLGDILEENGNTDFGLTSDILKTVRKIDNARCACTLMDITLRYMNEEEIEGKRWFYRSVEAFYIGYPPMFRRKIK
jgi:hypothetical protein